MRDMTATNDTQVPPKPTPRRATFLRLRPWAQTVFLLLWFAPLAWVSAQLGRWARSIPSCVFHCYYSGAQLCPLASFSCPVGIVAQLAALGAVPYLAIAVVVFAAGLVGSLVCGWACPFGFIQDLLAKVPLPKLRIPSWMGYGRYAVLVLLVVALPYAFGAAKVPYDDQEATICRWCPAGALEAGVPSTIQGIVAGKAEMIMSPRKVAVLAAFLIAAVFTFRPWCTVLCPLGGFLALFNRISVFHLRFDADRCTECNLCRSRCSSGVKLERAANTSGCIRCLECTTCGAIWPAFGARGAGRST